MTRLHELRKRLSRLRRRRRRVRWGTGYSAVLLAALWILAAAFLVDWLFEMDRLQRLISLIVCAAVAVWAFRRYTLPWLGHRETDADMALLVERIEHIDTDLIAAVQFESPEAPAWGSVQLEQAVIDQVAVSGKKFHVMRGLSRRELSHRVIALAVTAAIAAGICVGLPSHVSTFLQRFFLLSPVHYPTDTVIDSIIVKSHKVNPEDPDAPIDWTTVQGKPVDPVSPGEITVLYGQRVRLEVKCSSKVLSEEGDEVFPDEGRAELTASLSGLRKTLEMPKVDGTPGLYAVELDPLRDEVRYQLYFGDAWTDPGVLRPTKLPVVTVQLEVKEPAYAVAEKEPGWSAKDAGLRHFSVMEGSRVRVKVFSDKELEQTTLTIVGQSEKKPPFAFEHVESDDSGDSRDSWILDSDDSPLANVIEPIRYAIEVTDKDNQQLDRPIEGTIRVQADTPPRVKLCTTVTPNVLPTAVPTVYYRVDDDYGLDRISLQCRVDPVDGREVEPGQIDVYQRRPSEPLLLKIAPMEGYALDFSSLDLGLKKGDKMVVTLRAEDFRGRRKGKSTSADPLVFRVTDRQGIRESIREADRQSSERLKTMIQRQLGIGESP